MRASRLLFSVALAAAASCQVRLTDDDVYQCANEADCAGEGYECVKPPGRTGYCCKQSPEVCDGKDNDCNGNADDGASESCYDGPAGTAQVGACQAGSRPCVDGQLGDCGGQVLPQTEVCNGVDDDCDGTADEGFDLFTDPQHCGGCNHPCLSNDLCSGGQCVPRCDAPLIACGRTCVDTSTSNAHCSRCDSPCSQPKTCLSSRCTCPDGGPATEANCANGIDDDCDDKGDCQDLDCNNLSCGGGCLCANLQRKEILCGDLADNDKDWLVDCADSDCQGVSCGTGCTCDGGAAHETICYDRQDNDGDRLADCADLLDCTIGRVCSSDGGMTCRDGGTCR